MFIMSPERVCTVIAASCILHKIAIDHNEPLPESEDDGEWNEDVSVEFAGVKT